MVAVPVLPEQQRRDTAAFPFDGAAVCADIDASPFGEPEYTVRERVTMRPALDVNGLWGGHTGSGAKTVIPNEAFAKISMRLVPEQDPSVAREMLCAHLLHRCPPGARTQGVLHPIIAAARPARLGDAADELGKVRVAEFDAARTAMR